MRSRKIIGYSFVVLGALLILASLALVIFNRSQDSQAQQNAEAAAAAIAALETATLPEPETAPTPPAETVLPPEPTDPSDPPTLSSTFLDGHEYVGYLVFPSLDRTLPVMKIKYVDDLQIAPCLEKGSPHTDDAVICAHNYPSHFGPIRDWKGGEEVQFQDLDGNIIYYTVSLVETIAPTDVEKVMDSEHDLVLYTCTPGGQKRVMVACDRV